MRGAFLKDHSSARHKVVSDTLANIEGPALRDTSTRPSRPSLPKPQALTFRHSVSTLLQLGHDTMQQRAMECHCCGPVVYFLLRTALAVNLDALDFLWKSLGVMFRGVLSCVHIFIQECGRFYTRKYLANASNNL